MKDAPQRGEVHELRGELVGGKLGRRFFHHLLQLLEGRAPRVVREAQDGELDLRRGEREKKRGHWNRKRTSAVRAEKSLVGHHITYSHRIYALDSVSTPEQVE